MKKTISLILTLFALTLSANAQSSHKIVKATDSKEDTHYYYYNAQNQLIWELVGTTRYEFEYNAAGQRTKRQTNLWVANPGAYQKSNYETYEYDADGNVTKTTVMRKPYGKDEYEEDDVFTNYTYEDGVAKTWDNYYKGTLYYNFRNTLTKNESGDVEKVVTERFDPDAPEKGWATTNTITYQYADLSADYVPANLKIDSKDGDITLTWSPVAGAEKYIVSYDNERKEVVGATTFQVTLGTGSRMFAVQAVINGVECNAAFCDTSVSDPGKLPITDLTVGDIFETEEETESEELGTRTFFNIPLSWTMPQGHSEVVKFNIYYNSVAYGNDCYQALVDPTATSYILRIDPFEVATHDEEGVLREGIDTPIYITVVYTTGESEKSNIITVNPFRTLGHEATSIATITRENNTPTYNLSGIRINSGKGIMIKNGKKFFGEK